jgi:hypothetical protein
MLMHVLNTIQSLDSSYGHISDLTKILYVDTGF